jgi:hypothetical protein
MLRLCSRSFNLQRMSTKISLCYDILIWGTILSTVLSTNTSTGPIVNPPSQYFLRRPSVSPLKFRIWSLLQPRRYMSIIRLQILTNFCTVSPLRAVLVGVPSYLFLGCHCVAIHAFNVFCIWCRIFSCCGMRQSLICSCCSIRFNLLCSLPSSTNLKRVRCSSNRHM